MKMQIGKWEMYSLGDHAFVFALEPKVDPQTINEIMLLNNLIQQHKLKGILDCIPSYHTLTIIYDINTFFLNNQAHKEQLIHFASQMIKELAETKNEILNHNASLIKVPVCYDIKFAMDIENMEQQINISKKEIISIHTSKVYEVYSIGFMPGFVYMGIVDERIQMLRHDKPRTQVMAGSVGIAGVQTGIYPNDSPGGWQIIGRTPIKIFDPNPEILAKFKVGDQIQFYAIDRNEFDQLNEHNL